MVDISIAQPTATQQKETVKVSLRVSPALHAALRRAAYEGNISMNQIGCEALAKATCAVFAQEGENEKKR